MRGRYKKWAVPYLEEHPEYVLTEIPSNDEFFKSEKTYLEIGIGKGDFINGISRIYEGHYLGIEREVSIIAMAARKVVEGERNDIKLICNDFDVLYDSLTNYKFDKIFLNFPDPWPKKRHEKRRLLTKERISKMLALLKDDGELRFKTDNDLLWAFTKEQLEEGKFNVVSLDEDYQPAEDDVQTEYEKNFRSKGKNIYRLILKK